MSARVSSKLTPDIIRPTKSDTFAEPLSISCLSLPSVFLWLARAFFFFFLFCCCYHILILVLTSVGVQALVGSIKTAISITLVMLTHCEHYHHELLLLLRSLKLCFLMMVTVTDIRAVSYYSGD